jgi:L-rhamnose mutarotase
MRYIGSNYEQDMAEIGKSEATRKWWKMTDGMQESYVPGATGSESGPDWWTNCEEVFRMEG